MWTGLTDFHNYQGNMTDFQGKVIRRLAHLAKPFGHSFLELSSQGCEGNPGLPPWLSPQLTAKCNLPRCARELFQKWVRPVHSGLSADVHREEGSHLPSPALIAESWAREMLLLSARRFWNGLLLGRK